MVRRRLRDHNALVAKHENAYNQAQEAGRATEGRLPQLKEQAAQADREAADAARQAQHHSDGEHIPCHLTPLWCLLFPGSEGCRELPGQLKPPLGHRPYDRAHNTAGSAPL